jgi:hypothetical protein
MIITRCNSHKLLIIDSIEFKEVTLKDLYLGRAGSGSDFLRDAQVTHLDLRASLQIGYGPRVRYGPFLDDISPVALLNRTQLFAGHVQVLPYTESRKDPPVHTKKGRIVIAIYGRSVEEMNPEGSGSCKFP